MDERRKLVAEYNALRTEVQRLSDRLERLEAHEGEDGTHEDIAGQCALVEEIAQMRRRIAALRAVIYPK